ncbi:hypothetical protein ACC785_37140, partial [Rhizobium ruizarguesonis]
RIERPIRRRYRFDSESLMQRPRAEFGKGKLGIEVASLRTADVADHLNEQNGLYTMLIRDTSGTVAQVIGPILQAHVATRDPAGLLDRLEDPAI